jgi:signal peptidase II
MTSESSLARRRWLFALTALITLALDQLTKILAEAFLVEGPISVIGDLLRFRLAYNDAAAFSLGFGATWVFAITSVTAVVALLIFGPKVKTMSWAFIAGLVLGGAAGNGIDRVFREPAFFNGHVVDFIQIPFNFPIFNLADSFLVIGVSLAMYRTFRGDAIGGGIAK